MAYEIPHKLQYEEKLIFGLTAKQVGFAAVTIFPAFLILVKSSLPFMLKLAISTILAFLGILFMFFNFHSHIKNIARWHKFRKVNASDRKMKSFIGVGKIQNGVIYVNHRGKL